MSHTIFIVQRDNAELYHALGRTFAQDAEVEVVLDRRTIRTRRLTAAPREVAERRRFSRRERTVAEVHGSGWSVLRVRNGGG